LESDQINQRLLTATATIVSSFVGAQTVSANDVPGLISVVRMALADLLNEKPSNLAVTELSARPKPFVAVAKSVHQDYLVCLSCGQKVKMLKRHIMDKHNLLASQYRRHWGLPDNYPIVASGYSARRSELAKASQLGRNGPRKFVK